MRNWLWCGVAITAFVACATESAMAQVAGDNVPGEVTADFYSNNLVRSGLFARTADVDVVERPHPDYQTIGAPLGGFTLNAALRATGSYNDNILALPKGPSDEVGLIEPSLALQSDWSRNSVSVFGRFGANLFADYPDQNTYDYALGTNDRLDLSSNTAVSLGGSVERSTEARTDISSPQAAVKPIRYDLAKLYLGAVKQFNRLRLVADVDVKDYSYDNALSSSGSQIYQKDRDVAITTLSTRAEYAINSGVSVYVSAAGNNRSYRDAAVGEPGRSSNGLDIATGANFDITHLLRGEVELGYVYQAYQNAAYPTVSGVDLRGRLQYFFSPLTTFTLTSAQNVGDTAIVGSAGYLQTVAELQVDHELTRNLILGGHIAYEDDSIRGIDRHDDRPFAGLTAKFLINRSLGVVGSYDYLRDYSSGALRGLSYSVNRIFVSFIYQL